MFDFMHHGQTCSEDNFLFPVNAEVRLKVMPLMSIWRLDFLLLERQLNWRMWASEILRVASQLVSIMP